MYAMIYGSAICLATCAARVLPGNPSSSMMLDHGQPTPFQLAAAQLSKLVIVWTAFFINIDNIQPARAQPHFASQSRGSF